MTFVSSSVVAVLERGNFFDRHFALWIISEEIDIIMGVHGLWRLIEPSGKPVPLESLENKILAVDVSIWLHQFIKGFQDSRGAPVPNAHLLGIYHRVCKLLYFRIKPVFVFDGGVPVLKRQTIAKRNQQRTKTLSEASTIHKNLLSALIKHTALSKVLSEKTKAAITSSTSPPKKTKTQDDLYMLPEDVLDSTISSDEDSIEEPSHSEKHYDLHSIDTKSVDFKSLPVDVRHEILTDLKETRKQSSWGRLHELPTQSDDFSGYQMNRLLKRQSVQSALEEAEKEMGGHSMSLGELEQILKDQGVISNLKGNRIASDENTRFLFIKDLKQAIEDAKKTNGSDLATIEEVDDEENNQPSTSKDDVCEETPTQPDKTKNNADEEFEEELERAIALSLGEIPSTSCEETKQKKLGGKGKNRMPLSFLQDFDDADFDDSEESDTEESIRLRLTPAQRYMMEYSGLTPSEIAKIIAKNSTTSNKPTEEPEGAKIKAFSEEKNEEIVTSSTNAIIDLEVEHIVTDTETKNKSVGYENNLEKDKPSITKLSEGKDTEDSIQIDIEDVSDKTVEIMSDSESSDDFVDVEDEKKEKCSPVKSMEVLIQPDEEIEDDLFKDIFEKEEEKQIETVSSKPVEVIVIPNEKVEEDLSKDVSANEENKEKPLSEQLVPINENSEEKEQTQTAEEKTTSENLKEKIEKIIENYSKPREKDKNLEKSKLSVERMNEMRENLQKEQTELLKERSNKERLASNLTDQVYREAQELLELFGVPYLIAPMEAEAQCAFLELVELTDGTITDDSDIWLFGGRTVYRNFFNQSKTVLEFKSESIHQHFKLTREQMILLAMLVGSDYTVGLSGVGPVTALEILAAFPPKNQLISGLSEFKSWFNKGSTRKTLRNKLKNISFSENFPNPQIAQAYLDPEVETSKEKFSWSKPDVVGLVDFARKKFGWTNSKTEEILNPVLKRLEDHRKQKTITDYYKLYVKINSGETEKQMSKRVKTALQMIEQGVTEEEPQPKKRPKKSEENEAKPKRAPKNKKNDAGEDDDSKPKITKRAPRKKKIDAGETDESKPKISKRAPRKKKIEDQETPKTKPDEKGTQEVDEEIEILKKTTEISKKRVEEIHKEVHRDIKEKKEKKINLSVLHKKEIIPQKQRDKADMLRNKIKAIETFRKSKQGPGFVKKRGKAVKKTKEDASYLSESDSD